MTVTERLTTAAPPDDPVRVAIADPEVMARLKDSARIALRFAPAVEVEDVVSQVIERALKKKSEFDPTRSVTAWIHGFVTNVVRESKRAAYQRTTQPPADGPSLDQLIVARIDREPDMADIRLQAKRHLSKLTTDERAVIVPRYFDDLDLKEIAARLGITHTAARARFSRAFRKLRDLAASNPKEDRS